MTIDFIQIEMFAVLITAGISTYIWGIWKIIYALAQEHEKESEGKNESMEI